MSFDYRYLTYFRRWLFVQDNCPMCTAPIIQVTKPQPPAEHQPDQGQVHPEPVQAGPQLPAGPGEPHYGLPDAEAGSNREADGAFPSLASNGTPTRDKIDNSIHADNIKSQQPVRIPSETCSSSTLHDRNRKDLTDEDSLGQNQVGSSAEGSEVLADCDSTRESQECRGGGEGLRQRFVSEHHQPLQSK